MTRLGFSFNREPIWMLAFSAITALVGGVLLLFAVLFR